MKRRVSIKCFWFSCLFFRTTTRSKTWKKGRQERTMYLKQGRTDKGILKESSTCTKQASNNKTTTKDWARQREDLFKKRLRKNKGKHQRRKGERKEDKQKIRSVKNGLWRGNYLWNCRKWLFSTRGRFSNSNNERTKQWSSNIRQQ